MVLSLFNYCGPNRTTEVRGGQLCPRVTCDKDKKKSCFLFFFTCFTATVLPQRRRVSPNFNQLNTLFLEHRTGRLSAHNRRGKRNRKMQILRSNRSSLIHYVLYMRFDRSQSIQQHSLRIWLILYLCNYYHIKIHEVIFPLTFVQIKFSPSLAKRCAQCSIARVSTMRTPKSFYNTSRIACAYHVFVQKHTLLVRAKRSSINYKTSLPRGYGLFSRFSS